MHKTLRGEIAAWDQKSSADIGAIYDRFCRDSGFAQSLIDMLDQPPLQRGATWLLKHHLEAGAALSPDMADLIYRQADRMSNWESTLHLLQSMAFLPVPAARLAQTQAFVRRNLNSDNKFVRAWAYDGFYRLARQFPALQAEASALFHAALDTETAASVLVRIRKLAEAGF